MVIAGHSIVVVIPRTMENFQLFFVVLFLGFSSIFCAGSLTKEEYNRQLREYLDLQVTLRKACESYGQNGFETFEGFCRNSLLDEKSEKILEKGIETAEMDAHRYAVVQVECKEVNRKLKPLDMAEEIISGLLLASGVQIARKDQKEMTKEGIEEAIKEIKNVQVVKQILELVVERQYKFEQIDDEIEELFADYCKGIIKHNILFPSVSGILQEAKTFRKFAQQNSSLIDFASDLDAGAHILEEYSGKIEAMKSIENVKNVEAHVEQFVKYAVILIKTHLDIRKDLAEAGFDCNFVRCLRTNLDKVNKDEL